MAKGFTVKAKTPTAKKEPEWDYERAKELLKGKQSSFVYQVEESHLHF